MSVKKICYEDYVDDDPFEFLTCSFSALTSPTVSCNHQYLMISITSKVFIDFFVCKFLIIINMCLLLSNYLSKYNRNQKNIFNDLIYLMCDILYTVINQMLTNLKMFRIYSRIFFPPVCLCQF